MTLPSSLKKKEKVEEEKPIEGMPSSFRRKQPKDSFLKSTARTAYQIPSAIAQTRSFPLDLLQMAGLGHAIDPEEIEHLRKIYEREGIPFDEEKYLKGVQEASESFPTQGNLERTIEERTGAPLTPRNKLQKAVKLGAGASTLTPGGLLQKGIAGVGAPAVSEGLQNLGVPEILSDILGIGGVSSSASQIPGKISAEIARKPSGLTSRRFENITKPRQVSGKKISKINEKIENEFRGLAENIIEKSPINATHTALKNDAQFKNTAREAFKEVSTLSEQLPEKFSTEEVSKELVNQAFKKSGKGFTESEFDQSHQKFVKDYTKKMENKQISAKDLVDQYRKNNEALSEAYEPGQSFAYNRAKRQALTDYNKAIAETIDKKFPDSEFGKLFKDTNKQWSQIMDAESIDKFFDKMFDGKIKFEKGRQFFDKQGMAVPFERALGKEGFKDFSQLMNDLMSYEQASKLMKVAEKKGFDNLVSTGLTYLIHPKLGIAKHGAKITKDIFKKAYDSLLDKPKISLKWNKGVKAFKKGDFKEAEKIFNDLDQQLQIIPKKNINDIKNIFKKYNVNDIVNNLHELGKVKNIDDVEKAFLKYYMSDLRKIEEETGMSFKEAIHQIIKDHSQNPKS